jgi:hypothetical protein
MQGEEADVVPEQENETNPMPLSSQCHTQPVFPCRAGRGRVGSTGFFTKSRFSQLHFLR